MRDLLKRGLRLLGGSAPDVEPNESSRRPLYVITLSLAPVPLPLAPPRLPEVGGLTVFRARRIQGTREIHLQQLGYFESRLAAEALLRQLEPDYPAAVVELAAGGMGSLDDTIATRFLVLQAPSVAPNAPEAGSAPQYYAVQLLRQNAPIELTRIPRPPLIRPYTLYRVQSDRDGVITFGLRLGFLTDPAKARLIADSVRAQFPRAALVPVSEREHARVAGELRRK